MTARAFPRYLSDQRMKPSLLPGTCTHLARKFAAHAALVLAAASGMAELPRHRKYGFPDYTPFPAGRQGTGQNGTASAPAPASVDAQ